MIVAERVEVVPAILDGRKASWANNLRWDWKGANRKKSDSINILV